MDNTNYIIIIFFIFLFIDQAERSNERSENSSKYLAIYFTDYLFFIDFWLTKNNIRGYQWTLQT